MKTHQRAGLVHDLPEAEYHGGAELSVSGAKDLLRSPATYAHRREHRPQKTAFDVGSAFHALVLGVGDPIHVVDADAWTTKAARAERDEARAGGRTPLLREEHARAVAMLDAVMAHPLARAVLESDGRPEVSMFWQEDASNGVSVDCRARADFVHPSALVDLKSAADATASGFTRAAVNLRYAMQHAVYRRAYAQVTGQAAPPFLFVVAEKEPPHLVAVHQLDDDFEALGGRWWAEAVDVFAECTTSGQWPGLGEQVHVLSPPRWAA